MAQDFVWQDGDRVMFIGDSITEDPQGYTRLVAAMVTARYPERRIEYFPRGVGGNRISDLVERLDRDILGNDPRPTWVSVSVGLNDAEQGNIGTPLGRFRELYDELLQRLVALNTTVACFTTTVFGEDLHNLGNQALVGYNEAIREIAFAYKAQVIDVNAVFHDALTRVQPSNTGFRFTTDGRHLNVYGSYLMAMTLLQALNFALPAPGFGKPWEEQQFGRAA